MVYQSRKLGLAKSVSTIDTPFLLYPTIPEISDLFVCYNIYNEMQKHSVLVLRKKGGGDYEYLRMPISHDKLRCISSYHYHGS